MPKPSKPALSPGLTAVDHLYQHSRRNSWQHLNGAMRDALMQSITLNLQFEPEDFTYINQSLAGRHWFGGIAEAVYSAACRHNLSAAKAFEHAIHRTPWQWKEKSNKLERLAVGSRFTWRGTIVTVTSISDKDDTLIACAYDKTGGDEAGSIGYHEGAYRRTESIITQDDGTILVRYSPPMERPSAKPAKLFKIKHQDLDAERTALDKQMLDYRRRMKSADSLENLEAVRAEVVWKGQYSFRHFDVENLRNLYSEQFHKLINALSPTERESYYAKQKAAKAVEGARNKERWLAGESISFYSDDPVLCRVRGQRVETSHGNSCTLAGAKAGIAFAIKHRKKGWKPNADQTSAIDLYPVKKIDTEGVTVGCTFITWAEIDRLLPILKAAS